MDMGALVLKVGLNKVIMEPELAVILAPGRERHALLLLRNSVQLIDEQGGGGRPHHAAALPAGPHPQATGLTLSPCLHSLFNVLPR